MQWAEDNFFVAECGHFLLCCVADGHGRGPSNKKLHPWPRFGRHRRSLGIPLDLQVCAQDCMVLGCDQLVPTQGCKQGSWRNCFCVIGSLQIYDVLLKDAFGTLGGSKGAAIRDSDEQAAWLQFEEISTRNTFKAHMHWKGFLTPCIRTLCCLLPQMMAHVWTS